MTKAEFVSLVNAVGGPEHILNVICDNSMIVRFYDDNHILDLDEDLVTIDGVDYIKNYTEAEDSRPHKRSEIVHKITTYHPMEIIQGVQVLDDPKERQFLDMSVMFDL